MHKFCALFLFATSLTFTSCETLPSSSQNVGIIFYKDDIFIPTDFQLSYLTSTLSNLKYTEDINHFYEEKYEMKIALTNPSDTLYVDLDSGECYLQSISKTAYIDVDSLNQLNEKLEYERKLYKITFSNNIFGIKEDYYAPYTEIQYYVLNNQEGIAWTFIDDKAIAEGEKTKYQNKDCYQFSIVTPEKDTYIDINYVKPLYININNNLENISRVEKEKTYYSHNPYQFVEHYYSDEQEDIILFQRLFDLPLYLIPYDQGEKGGYDITYKGYDNTQTITFSIYHGCIYLDGNYYKLAQDGDFDFSLKATKTYSFYQKDTITINSFLNDKEVSFSSLSSIEFIEDTVRDHRPIFYIKDTSNPTMLINIFDATHFSFKQNNTEQFYKIVSSEDFSALF